ncbi:S8 family peptidase [Bifidobacterium simiarum]|uniref:Serine protease n=1 Tax=Bifidobacterium simiarum TaxID=2045441 RepID=A0A2M9HCM0_9BIFI|nr:S8 family peptidase [Bifidobacterium simiarum]MBT1166146.1 S8 family peptidase [Bifidobacterium simiarum]PJM74564.1 serine protease [Bifidobacterium simiarum]
MNTLLELRKPFESRTGTAAGGPPHIPREKSVSADKLMSLADELRRLLDSWPKDSLIGSNVLVEAHYRDVVAKSNRMLRLLRQSVDVPVNRSVVGARFERNHNGSPRHVITYCVTKDTVKDTAELLCRCARYLRDDTRFNGVMESIPLDKFNRNKQCMPDGLTKTGFAQVVKDAYYVNEFTLPQGLTDDASTGSFITLFDTGLLTVDQMMTRLGIPPTDYQTVDRLTFVANNESLIDHIRRSAPYLVSMSAVIGDFSQEPLFHSQVPRRQAPLIPSPSNEPTVGVIDTGFDESAYFSEWVTMESHIRSITRDKLSDEDMRHGTAVTSIIVDGPTLNPQLDDGCGRFRVRHFTVARDGVNSPVTILEQIESIVKENLDIKVWNLSLGSKTEISRNFVSPIAALLDRLQFDYDVMFVVAGTNLPTEVPDDTRMRIGSPADSINSIVVNACDSSGKPASYTRRGPVLEFFRKPDIAYYGGDKDGRIKVWTPRGIVEEEGTSLAAPWITRKIAYLIHIMGFSRQTAKALLIDAATTWRTHDEDDWRTQGFGVPPIRIDDILQTPNDEIRFTISGVAERYETYQLQLPVPVDNKGRHPFMARATLCYFPQCDRHQGVDYTKTELDLHFGRVKPPSEARLRRHPDAKPTVESINGNIQAELAFVNLLEGNARLRYRKWDNTKVIFDIEKSRFAARKTYTPQGFWGISVLAKERWKPQDSDKPRALPFGTVITLREMEGRNRIEDFKRQCMMWGWTINTITIENRIDIYAEGEQEITFE